MKAKEIYDKSIADLTELTKSGYWPFASPAPCTTEVKIKKAVRAALENLHIARCCHEQMFGHGRDENSSPRSVITDISVPEKSEWKVTDPDTAQRCRVLTYPNGRKEFEFEQGKPLRAFINVAETIAAADTPEELEDFVKTYLHPFGYTGLEDVKEKYGDDWEQIVAECIFETDIFEDR